MNHRRYSLYQLDSKSPLPADIYSRFKYGCTSGTRFFARQLARLLYQLVGDKKEIIISSSAFLYVPTAASLLLREMLEQFLDDRFHLADIKRSHILSVDYAMLSAIQRKEEMEKVHLDFEYKDFSGKDVIIIDDSFVTGAHEQTILRHLGDLPGQLSFVYIVNLSNSNEPDIERWYNNFSIRSLQDLKELMDTSDYMINSRALKMVMTAPEDDFILFINQLSANTRRFLADLAKKEGYQYMKDTFIDKFFYLSETSKVAV